MPERMTASRHRLLIALVLTGAACSSSTDTGDSHGHADSTVGCREKAGASTDSDCSGRDGTPRKLDCDDPSQTDEAVAAGCVLEKPGDSDVCCPLDVHGQKETTLACTEPADTLTDSDCVGTTRPRKLDCATADEHDAAIAAGCAPEDPGDVTDYDVCCPEGVRGAH